LSLADYQKWLLLKKEGTRSILKHRLVIYEVPGINPTILVDCYPSLDGEPAIAILKKPTQGFHYKMPGFLQVVREITDEPQYSRRVMSKDNYYMDPRDKLAQTSGCIPTVEPKSPWALVQAAPADPVFGLIHMFSADPNPKKALLGVGIYKDERNQPHVMEVVRKAEQIIIDQNRDKEYSFPDGNPAFRDLALALAYGQDHPAY
jgi:hypothetical protein